VLIELLDGDKNLSFCKDVYIRQLPFSNGVAGGDGNGIGIRSKVTGGAR